MKLTRLLSSVMSRVGLSLGVLALFVCFSTAVFAAPADNAFVRVVHASPAAGPVDVFVDGSALLSNFQFSTVTNYVSVPAGAHTIKVAPAGQGINAAVITQSVSVNAGIPYTVAAIGTKDTGFSLAAFVDNNLVTPGQAKVRVYHLSPNAGPVDVAAGGKTVISGLTYKNASDYLTVPAAAYTFNVTATQAGATVPVPATVNAHTVVSVFAVGLFKGSPALTFVAGVANGFPGSTPNTGSAPMSNATLPWMLGAAALLLIGGGVATRRFAVRSK
ncbi:MAG: DUF4397 domain-containing protein [Ktedonobacteraceae bacterium]